MLIKSIIRTVFPYAVWGTQHGGLVRREGNDFVFIEAPPGAREFQVGDVMPEGWAIMTRNTLAMLATEGMIAS